MQSTTFAMLVSVPTSMDRIVDRVSKNQHLFVINRRTKKHAFPRSRPRSPKLEGGRRIASDPLRVSIALIFSWKIFSRSRGYCAGPVQQIRGAPRLGSFSFLCLSNYPDPLSWRFRAAVRRYASINWPVQSRYLAICFREGSRKCVARSVASIMLQARDSAISARRHSVGCVRSALI